MRSRSIKDDATFAGVVLTCRRDVHCRASDIAEFGKVARRIHPPSM